MPAATAESQSIAIRASLALPAAAESAGFSVTGAPDAAGVTRRWCLSLLAHAALAAAAVGWACRGGGGLAAAAALSAFATVHLGYHAHDLSHGQVPGLRQWRRAAEYLCWNLLLGVSTDWWRDRHGRHHVETHVPGRDPDLYALFAYDAADLGSRRAVQRWFLRRQHLWFWLATSPSRLYYQWFSFAHALRLRGWRGHVERLLLALHHALVLGGGAWLMGPALLPFLLLGHLLSGLYLGVVFSTNHLGMPHPAGAGAGREWQVSHTRNVRSGLLGDYLFGGLNLQIEHHLHPTMDRRALRALQAATEMRCAALGLPYHCCSLRQALREVHASLRDAAGPAR